MNLFLEIVVLLLRILWSIIEAIFRTFIPVARKKIDGEIVLITGGGGRIAECMAMEFAKLNVTIVLWDINEAAVNGVAEKVRAEGCNVHTYICDITKKEQVFNTAAKVEEEVGHVTILINNAGILISKSFMNHTDNELVKQIEVNTISHFWTVKAFLPHMYTMNYGHIVTVASLAGIVGGRNLSAYNVSKHGAVGFHRSLRSDFKNLGKTGIKVTCICPAAVDTPLLTETKWDARFALHRTLLKSDFVAKQAVDGILRNANFVMIPKSFTIIIRMMSYLPQKGQDIMNDFFDAGFRDANPHLGFQMLRKESANENKKTE